MQIHIPSNLNGGDREVFWYDCPPRQSGVADAWAENLSSVYEKDFVPVRRFFREVHPSLRGEAYALAGASDNRSIAAIKEQIVRTQGRLITVPFSYRDAEPTVAGEHVVMPDRTLAQELDSKFNQYQLFKKLGLPAPDFNIIPADEAAGMPGSFYYSAEFSNGGMNSGRVDTLESRKALAAAYGSSAIMRIRDLGAATSAPSYSAVTDKHGNSVLLMESDQILSGNRYLGNSTRMDATAEMRDSMREMTIELGRKISRMGYVGVFCADYFIDENEQIWITDLNPRRFGHYGLANELSHGKTTRLEAAAHSGARLTTREVPIVQAECDYASFGILPDYEDEFFIANDNLRLSGPNAEAVAFNSYYPNGTVMQRNLVIGQVCVNLQADVRYTPDKFAQMHDDTVRVATGLNSRQHAELIA